MVIIASKEGQIANRIWQASYFMVNAKAHGYSVRHPFFSEFRSYYSHSISTNKNLFPIRFGLSQWKWLDAVLVIILSTLIKAWKKTGVRSLFFCELVVNLNYDPEAKNFDLNNPDFVRKAKKKLVFVYGWIFEDKVNLKRFSDDLRKFWTPDDKYLQHLQQIMTERGITRIGVHIRRGDYHKFNNGIWYYDHSTYRNIMQMVLRLNQFSGKKILFFICSDEKISMTEFREFNAHAAERSFMEDLYGLAGCDYILAPPSTFSMWASFYGGVPLLIIKDKNQKIRMEDFEVVN